MSPLALCGEKGKPAPAGLLLWTSRYLMAFTPAPFIREKSLSCLNLSTWQYKTTIGLMAVLEISTNQPMQ